MSDANAVIRVLVVDDHPLIRAGLRAVLDSTNDLRVVAEAPNGDEAVRIYASMAPDVVLMDLRMPGGGGLEALKLIRQHDREAAILVLTTFEGDADIRRALDAGARGYLLKDMLGDEVPDAIRAVARGSHAIAPAVAQQLAAHVGEPALTEREIEVLSLLATGMANREIAREIGRTDETVKMHLRRIFEKLGVHDRVAAVGTALRRGLIRLP